jgi:hypothetical protein
VNMSRVGTNSPLPSVSDTPNAVPGNRVIGNPLILARPRQLSRLQSELQKLARAQSNRMAIRAGVAVRSAVAHAAGQIQKYLRVQYSRFSPAGKPQTLQSLFLICGET